MSSEMKYLITYDNYTYHFNIIYGEIDLNKECDFCSHEYAHVLTSVKLSNFLWPAPIDNPYAFIGKNCINNSVKINYKYIAYNILNKIIRKDISNIIIGYL